MVLKLLPLLQEMNIVCDDDHDDTCGGYSSMRSCTTRRRRRFFWKANRDAHHSKHKAQQQQQREDLGSCSGCWMVCVAVVALFWTLDPSLVYHHDRCGVLLVTGFSSRLQMIPHHRKKAAIRQREDSDRLVKRPSSWHVGTCGDVSFRFRQKTMIQKAKKRPSSADWIDPDEIDDEQDNKDNTLIDFDGEQRLGQSSFAPRSDRENYISEAQLAQQSNLLAGISASTAGTTATALRPTTTPIELQTEVSNSFLQYALSIIMGRAIPDARDGLKPVHRRILFAMVQLQLIPSRSHRKCARVVGEVLGKFHPHGDVAVYDALVRMAQSFQTRYAFIDGHGNFGSVDADPAAAMRYTECRLTRIAAAALLEDLQSDTVDFVTNFDGNEIEPSVLPAKLPVLLLNGSSGIAVGMATNIPPHNLREIMTACTMLVQQERLHQQPVSENDLLRIVPGPDFPTGAAILGSMGSKQLYTTGNGGVIMRATTQIEALPGQRRNAIIVTELPYQVNKSALLEKIASLVNDKKLDGISDLRDESDRDGIRMVIELKRDAVAAVVLNNLYQKTQLQTTFSGNFLALMSNSNNKSGDYDDDFSSNTNNGNSLVPQRFTLRQALDCFLNFRFHTIRRKSRFQISKVQDRTSIVDGLLIALDKVDLVIDIVRSASDQNEARLRLERMLGTNEKQTDAILRLQLGQLTRLDKGKLEREKSDLEESRQQLTALIEQDSSVYHLMVDEFDDLVRKFGDDRRTRILHDEDGDVSEIDLIRNSRSVLVVTRGGYIKRMPLKTFQSQGRGTRGKRGTSSMPSSGGATATTTDRAGSLAASSTALSLSSFTAPVDNTDVAHCFTCNDHDTILMITQRGIAYGLRAYEVPVGSRTSRGHPIPSVLPVRAEDVITTFLPVSEFRPDEYVVLATEQGLIKKTALSAFEHLTNRGLTIASLRPGDRLRWCQPCRDGDTILIGTTGGMSTRFEASELRPSGRTSRGVIAMKLREGDTIAEMIVLRSNNSLTDSEHATTDKKLYALVVTSSGFGKRVPVTNFRTQSRGGLGVIAIKFKKGQQKEADRVCCLSTVSDEDEILLITAKGVMVRQKAARIPVQSRTATGVMLQRLDPGDQISSVSIVPQYEETDDDEDMSMEPVSR